MLGIVSLRQDSPDAADLAVSLAALKDWSFLFGPGLVVPFGNGLILGYLMYRSGLVPRRMTWLGLIGGLLLLIIANVGTAVVLYPIVRRQNELLAIGYVTARVIECVFLAGGIIFVLGVVSLRQDSPDAADLAVSLAALKDWTFLFGPGFIVPFGNGLILGYLMYKSGLVPRRMAWLGLIGGPLLLIGNIGVLFDWWEPTSAAGLLVAPEFFWELSLGIYAAVWGFRRAAPILSARER